MSGPDLHVFTLKFLVLNNLGFFHFFGVKKIFEHLFYKKGIMQLFSTDAFNGLIIGPDHSPQLRIDFSYYEILGPDICSLILYTS